MQSMTFRSGGLAVVLGAGVLLALAGCRTTGVNEPFEASSGSAPVAAASVPESVTAGEAGPAVDLAAYEYDSVWTYLRDRHDADGDGRVSPEEYGRDQQKFARLDGNKDGVLTPEDFAPSGGGRMRMPRGMMARMVLMRSFDADDDAETLTRDEVGTSFADYDLDGDGLLAREEFDDVFGDREGEQDDGDMMAGMMKRMMGDRSPFDLLQTGIKTESTDELSLDELLAFFDENDSDHDGAWSYGGSRRGSGGSKEVSGPAAGIPAPDFALQPLAGGEPVTLSSFAGKKPVALIFGSYT